MFAIRLRAAGAITATLLRLPQLAYRYFLGGIGRAESPDALLLNVDACNRAARGLVMVDPSRAAYFAVLNLLGALRSGDRLRVGRALICVLGSPLTSVGGPMQAWARSMLRRAEQIASELEDPHLDGSVILAGAQADFLAGRFESMLERCDQGARILSENCRGVRWDLDVANMGALRALEELGRIGELRRRLADLIEEAISLDDLYAEVTFRLYDAFWKISRGETDEARSEARDVVRRWGREGYLLQHLYELRIEAYCDVYEGEPHEAWARVEAAWPALERSGLLAHSMLRSDAVQLRAHVALAAAEHLGPRVQRETREAARTLERMGRKDSIAASCLLRAAAAEGERERPRALALLAQAEASYASAGMTLHVAYCVRRRGELLGGGEGGALAWSADQTLGDAGIVSPSRWLEIQAPGFRVSGNYT